MKIDYLEIGAVGPYPGVHKIDFSQLGESALFLIDGPTGAGKTTIIDAIVFALFGSPVGAESDRFKLRSNHAKSDTETYVVLRFTVSAGTYEIRRTPQYDKTKADGSKTSQNAECRVDRINPGGSRDNLANQVKAAGIELQELIGLEREQFRQTVVLPQGEFAKFLTSDSKERRPILQRIFATQRYEKIEFLLKDMSKSARDEVDSLKGKVHSSIDTFKGRMDLSDEFGEQLKVTTDSALNTDDVRDALSEVTSKIKVSFESAKIKSDELTAKHQDAYSIFELRKRESDAEAALTQARLDLSKSKEEFNDAVQEILAEHKKGLRDALIEPKSLSDVSLFGQTLESVNSAILDLQPALDAELKLEDSQSAASALRVALPDQLKRLEILDKQVQTELPKDISNLEEALKIARKGIEGREKLVEKIASIAEFAKLQETVETLTKNVGSHQESVNEATTLKNDAEDSYSQLIEQRFTNFASELANELKPGEPCLVCGSAEHPNPSTATNELISPDALEAEKQKVSRAQQVLEKAQKKLADSQSDLDKALGMINDKTVPSESDLDSFQKQLKESDAKILELASSEAILADKRAALESANERRTSLVAEVATNKATLTNLEYSIKLASTQISNYKHEFSSVEERTKALNELKVAIQNLEHLRVSIEQKQGALDVAIGVRNLLEEHENFGKVDDAKKSADEIGIELTTAMAELTEISKKMATATKDVTAILKNLDAQIKKSDDSRALIKLSNLVSGINQDKLPLSTYVLTTLFEDVVDAANVRLAGMLEGRYSLATSETAVAGNKKTGLDLVIYDARQDKERIVSTLSGGERFCVALALALGLAEIVQSNQGGISIDTLFIDEGFGTLDGSRLDDVMNVLSSLKKHGRTVGLISHVDSMKQQITEKITANPDLATGQSTLEVSWMS